MALTKSQIARMEGYDRDNREAAAIILRDIKKYGGEGSLAVRWARAIQAKPKLTWPKGNLCGENETAGA